MRCGQVAKDSQVLMVLFEGFWNVGQILEACKYSTAQPGYFLVASVGHLKYEVQIVNKL